MLRCSGGHIKKSRIISVSVSMLMIASGGGLIYASSSDYLSVGADSLSQSVNGSMIMIISFVLGVALIAAGIMTALFLSAYRSIDS